MVMAPGGLTMLHDQSVHRNTQVLRHHALVVKVARAIHARLPQSVELDDLIGVGIVGLIEAISRFNPARGVPFETYARHRVRGAILDGLRAADWVPHSVRRKAQAIERTRKELRDCGGDAPSEQEMARRLGIAVDSFRSLARDAEIRQLLSLDAPVANDNATPLVEQVASDADLEEGIGDGQLRQMLSHAIRGLPERECTAITLYYLNEIPLKEVGRNLGVTESRACQLCSQGIKRLRRRLGRAASA
jgi:RNA polymerase sigma factor for flagellar operon FliA